jgi:AcrR family transcriptional regulator
MIIPPLVGEATTTVASDWCSLEPVAKRERLLAAAAEVFAREGLDAPMPAVAAAAGAGVASVYRQFPSKRELLAALVARRFEQAAQAARQAALRDGDRWSALTEMLHALVGHQWADDFLGEARIAVADHPDVIEAAAHAATSIEALLYEARAEGRLRADATTLDLRLVFVATRAAKRVEPEAWPRMLELMVDALDSHRRA